MKEIASPDAVVFVISVKITYSCEGDYLTVVLVSF